MSEIQRVFVDMDGVLCNYRKRYRECLQNYPENKYPQKEAGFFIKLEEISCAIDGINAIAKHYDTWIATRPSIKNPLCYTEKRIWTEEHLGIEWVKRLIITPDKSLLIGEYLVDDQPWPNFKGKQLLFGGREYPSWKSILNKLKVR